MYKRNISFKTMIFFLVLIIIAGIYMFCYLKNMYYDSFKEHETSVFLDQNSAEDSNNESNIINIFGYELNIDDFKIFTK